MVDLPFRFFRREWLPLARHASFDKALWNEFGIIQDLKHRIHNVWWFSSDFKCGSVACARLFRFRFILLDVNVSTTNSNGFIRTTNASFDVVQTSILDELENDDIPTLRFVPNVCQLANQDAVPRKSRLIGGLCGIGDLRFATKWAGGRNHHFIASRTNIVEFVAGSTLVLVATLLALDVFVGTHQGGSHGASRNDKGFCDKRFE